MGLDIALQNERGQVIETVGDPKNLLHRVLERAIPDEPGLAEIDWNGDTTFSRLQVPRFLSQWAVVMRHSQSAEERDLTRKIEFLAERCRDGVHLYLKFIGD